MDDVITLNYEVSPDDFTRAGEASSDVKSKLKADGRESRGCAQGGHRHV